MNPRARRLQPAPTVGSALALGRLDALRPERASLMLRERCIGRSVECARHGNALTFVSHAAPLPDGHGDPKNSPGGWFRGT
jgi:hypothetical protein